MGEVVDAGKFLQPSRSHAFVTFNNQDSVLMSMYVEAHGLLCLLHDNRIFAFKKAKPTITENSSASSSSDEQNVILNLLTTPKYRAMSAMYLIFRLLDNLSFLIIIVRSVMFGDISFDTAPQLALLGAIGLELFYDVMLYTHKYWFLNRLSLYIGLLLFVGYYGIVLWKNISHEYAPKDFLFVLVVLTIRLCAFALEVSVDYVIDREVHDDLLILANRTYKSVEEPNDPDGERIPFVKNERLVTTSLLSRLKFQSFMYETGSKISSYLDITNYVEMPRNIVYVGSIFAWSPMSVFTEGVWRTKPFSRWPVWFLCIVPVTLTLVLVTVILVLCLIAFIIPVILVAICCGTCNFMNVKKRLEVNNFWNELIHF